MRVREHPLPTEDTGLSGFSESALAPVFELNGFFLEVLADAASRPASEVRPGLAVALKASLSRLNADARQKAAHRPVCLVDAGFRDDARWAAVAARADAQRPSKEGSFPRLQAIQLAHTTLTLAWTLARASPEAACVIFGMTHKSAAIFARLGVQTIQRIADRHAEMDPSRMGGPTGDLASPAGHGGTGRAATFCRQSACVPCNGALRTWSLQHTGRVILVRIVASRRVKIVAWCFSDRDPVSSICIGSSMATTARASRSAAAATGKGTHSGDRNRASALVETASAKLTRQISAERRQLGGAARPVQLPLLFGAPVQASRQGQTSQSPPTHTTPERLAHIDQRMTTTDVLRVVGVNRSTIFRWVKQEKFPQRHASGGWLRSDVERWLGRKMEASR